MFLTKIFFIIKFTCDKSEVTTPFNSFMVCFSLSVNLEEEKNIRKHQIFWNIVEVLKHQKKENRGSKIYG